MKKAVFILLAAAMLAFSAIGCNPVEEGEPAPTKFPVSMLTMNPIPFVEQTTSPDQMGFVPRTAGDALYTDVLPHPDGYSAALSGSYAVITDYAEFTRLFGDVSERTVNAYNEESFKISFVVAIYVTSNTGGWRYAVDNANNDGLTVSVNVTSTAPSPDALVTQAFETHVILVCFDSADYYDNLEYNITLNGKALTPEYGAFAES